MAKQTKATAQQAQSTDRAPPLYRSHKEVGALQISEVSQRGEIVVLSFLEDGYEPVEFHRNDAIFARYFPIEGDFLVIYRDGYRSISPEKEFVDGYTAVKDGDAPPVQQQGDGAPGGYGGTVQQIGSGTGPAGGRGTDGDGESSKAPPPKS